jgi:hypothetical protein
MGFENFPLARDLLYLMSALLGLSLGCVPGMLRKGRAAASRGRMLSLIICIFSGALAALAGALMCSGGAVLAAPALLPPSCAVALIAAAAACFPRAVAFPLVLLGGLAAVWLGFSFLRFTPLGSAAVPLASVYRDGEGAFRISLDPAVSAGRKGGRARPAPSAPLAAADTGSPLTFFAALMYFDHRVPLVGGERRCFISTIHREGELVFRDPRLKSRLLSNYYALFSAGKDPRCFAVETLRIDLPPDAVYRGMGQTLVFDGKSLSLSPAWRAP